MIDDIKEPLQVNVKTRYSSKEAKATIEKITIDKLKEKVIEENNIFKEGYVIKVTFEEKQARITPGQSAVFYIDDIVVGGGKIMK